MESQPQEDDQSEIKLNPAQRGRETFRRAGLESSSDDDQEEENPEEDEYVSPPGPSSHHKAPQGDRTGIGPHPPGTSFSTRQEGSSLYSRMGANLIDSIRNPRKHQASRDILDAFSGPPKKQCDLDHIRLKGTGW